MGISCLKVQIWRKVKIKRNSSRSNKKKIGEREEREEGGRERERAGFGHSRSSSGGRYIYASVCVNSVCFW